MAKLHSASPREITSPFTREIISVLHSKACNNLYVLLESTVFTLGYCVPLGYLLWLLRPLGFSSGNVTATMYIIKTLIICLIVTSEEVD